MTLDTAKRSPTGEHASVSGPTSTPSSSSRGAVHSAALTFGGGALVIVVVALALFVRARNLDARTTAANAASQHAAALAANLAAGEPASAVAALPRQPELMAAFVLGEGEATSTRYPFLTRRRFVAHTEAGLAGQLVTDKPLYDLTNASLARRVPQLRIETGATGEPALVAVAPVAGSGQVAGVVWAPAAEPRPLPLLLWLLALGGLVASVAAGAFVPRARHAVAAVALAVLAAYAYATLVRPFGPAASKLGGPLLGAAAALAIGFAVLGALGLGKRFYAGLHEHRHAIAYVTPAMAALAVLVLVPFAVGVGMAFFDHRHGHYTFAGAKNFIEVLSGGGHALTDPLNFWFILVVTVLWTGVNVVLHTSIGLAMALVLNQPWLGLKGIYRVLLVLPWAVPNYITALIWKGMFHQQYGAVNHLLAAFGLEPLSWFSHFWTSMTANVVTNTWLGFPFMMVISLGALQSIPADIYEAAEVDGASRVSRFTRLTLPLLKPALFPSVILGCIWTFNQFNIIYLVSKGEPGGKTNILVTEAYRWAFERGERYGLAAAYAVIIFVILLGYSWVTNRVTRATEGAYE